MNDEPRAEERPRHAPETGTSRWSRLMHDDFALSRLCLPAMLPDSAETAEARGRYQAGARRYMHHVETLENPCQR